MWRFSPGDVIAIIVGGVGVGKWMLDLFLSHEGRAEKHTDGIEGKLLQLSSDFAAHQAEDRTELRWIKEALVRVERKVDNALAQMRNVASGSNNRTIEMGGPAE